MAEVIKLGFPRERITSVQNAIDTTQLRLWRDQLSPNHLEASKRELGITGSNICVYSGGLYAEKRLGFLVAACDRVRAEIPDFHLLVIGDGPERSALRELAGTRAWLHLVGPQFEQRKVELMALAKLFLLPGLVGLAILDSFALGLPLIAVGDQQHSPEIGYLVPNYNGVLLPRDTSPSEYANEVIGLLGDVGRRELLVAGCEQSRQRFTIEEMVERFATGIESALGAHS